MMPADVLLEASHPGLQFIEIDPDRLRSNATISWRERGSFPKLCPSRAPSSCSRRSALACSRHLRWRELSPIASPMMKPKAAESSIQTEQDPLRFPLRRSCFALLCYPRSRRVPVDVELFTLHRSFRYCFHNECSDELRNDPGVYQLAKIFIGQPKIVWYLNAHFRYLFHNRFALCPVTVQAIHSRFWVFR